MYDADEQRLATAGPGTPGRVPAQGDGPDPAETRGFAPYDAPASGQPAGGKGLPLWARVLLADVALGLVALMLFVVIGVQRLDNATLSQRRTAYTEDLVVFFGVGAVFLLVAFLLRRAGQARIALAQLAVAVLALGLGGFAAATGSPAETVVTQIPANELPSTMNP